MVSTGPVGRVVDVFGIRHVGVGQRRLPMKYLNQKQEGKRKGLEKEWVLLPNI